MILKEVQKYNLADIWGITGGSLGFWIGSSFVGSAELIEYFVVSIIILIGYEKIVKFRGGENENRPYRFKIYKIISFDK